MWAQAFRQVDGFQCNDTSQPFALAYNQMGVEYQRLRQFSDSAGRVYRRALFDLAKLESQLADPDVQLDASLDSVPELTPVPSGPPPPLPNAIGFVPPTLAPDARPVAPPDPRPQPQPTAAIYPAIGFVPLNCPRSPVAPPPAARRSLEAALAIGFVPSAPTPPAPVPSPPRNRRSSQPLIPQLASFR